MKIVLDTNVLVSGLFFPGIPLRILEEMKRGKVKFIVTEEIIEEYKKTIDKLTEKFPGINVNAQLELIILSAEICQSKELKHPVCEDPDDDKFIACALAGGANIIVTGDKLLLKVSGYQKIQVLTPRQFYESYLK